MRVMNAMRLTALKTLEMALETRASRLSASKSNITPISCCWTFSPTAPKNDLVICGEVRGHTETGSWWGRGGGNVLCTCDL